MIFFWAALYSEGSSILIGVLSHTHHSSLYTIHWILQLQDYCWLPHAPYTEYYSFKITVDFPMHHILNIIASRLLLTSPCTIHWILQLQDYCWLPHAPYTLNITASRLLLTSLCTIYTEYYSFKITVDFPMHYIHWILGIGDTGDPLPGPHCWLPYAPYTIYYSFKITVDFPMHHTLNITALRLLLTSPCTIHWILQLQDKLFPMHHTLYITASRLLLTSPCTIHWILQLQIKITVDFPMHHTLNIQLHFLCTIYWIL